MFKLWRPVTLQPLELQECVAPFWKPLMYPKYEPEGQGRGSTFRVCHALKKVAILLNKSLIPSHLKWPALYIVYLCHYRLPNDEGQNWKFSSKKKSKLKILSYRRDIYLKIKLRTSTIQFQPKKERIFAKKNIFQNFSDFRDMLEDPLKFSMFNFSKISKKKSKNGFTGVHQPLKGKKSWILVNLAQTLWKWQTISDRPGTKCPPPGRIGLNQTNLFISEKSNEERSEVEPVEVNFRHHMVKLLFVSIYFVNLNVSVR